jgi:hypothetical protein
MKKTQYIHTPGPFHITQNTTPGQFGTDTKIRSADNSVIAVLHVNTKGNGPLLAAAPELLAALQLVYANAGESPEWIRARIGSVISKAEGNA